MIRTIESRTIYRDRETSLNVHTGFRFYGACYDQYNEYLKVVVSQPCTTSPMPYTKTVRIHPYRRGDTVGPEWTYLGVASPDSSDLVRFLYYRIVPETY